MMDPNLEQEFSITINEQWHFLKNSLINKEKKSCQTY